MFSQNNTILVCGLNPSSDNPSSLVSQYEINATNKTVLSVAVNGQGIIVMMSDHSLYTFGSNAAGVFANATTSDTFVLLETLNTTANAFTVVEGIATFIGYDTDAHSLFNLSYSVSTTQTSQTVIDGIMN